MQSSDFYAPFVGVTLTSLFENNKEMNSIKVYLLTKDMSKKNKRRIVLRLLMCNWKCFMARTSPKGDFYQMPAGK